MNILMSALIVVLCAFLYRWGGGGFSRLPRPLNRGWKLARRGVMPVLVGWITGRWTEAAAFSLLLSFNLDEIEGRDWESVWCYGLAHAWCFHWAGLASGILGVWWIAGVWLSNVGVPVRFWSRRAWRRMIDGATAQTVWVKRMDWFWVELVHGGLMGLLVAFK